MIVRDFILQAPVHDDALVQNPASTGWSPDLREDAEQRCHEYSVFVGHLGKGRD